MPKNVQTTVQLCSFHLLEGNAQNLQARLQQIINQELPDVFPENNTDFEEAQELEIKLPTFTGSWRKQGSSRKASTSASLTTLKSLTLWITTNCGKLLKRWENQTTLSVSLKNLYAGQEATGRTGPETMDWFKTGKGVQQSYILSPCLFNVCKSTSCKMPSWMKHKLESKLQEKYLQPQVCRWYHSNGRKWRETKEPLDECERGEWKS